MIFFLPTTAGFFSRATPFSALSILTILLDKCQMKCFKSISISIKVKTFLFEKPFVLEKTLFEKNMFLKIKKKVFEKIKIKKLFF